MKTSSEERVARQPRLKGISGRLLRFEILTRLRESAECAKDAFYPENRAYWLARVRAFDECYTQIKGMGIGVNR